MNPFFKINEIDREFTNRQKYCNIKVCGLKWSLDKQQLASSGNDYQVKIWNLHRPEPCLIFTEHTSCAKVYLDWIFLFRKHNRQIIDHLAWSPHDDIWKRFYLNNNHFMRSTGLLIIAACSLRVTDSLTACSGIIALEWCIFSSSVFLTLLAFITI